MKNVRFALGAVALAAALSFTVASASAASLGFCTDQTGKPYTPEACAAYVEGAKSPVFRDTSEAYIRRTSGSEFAALVSAGGPGSK